MKFSKREVLGVASPVFVSLLAQNLVGITDTAFMGRLGEVELGGAAMASMIYFCIFTLGFGLGTGTQIIVARKVGSGEHRSIGRVLSQSVIMLLVAAVFLATLGWLGGGQFFRLVLASDHVSDIAAEYWKYRIWGYFPAFLGVVFRAFYIGIARTKVLTHNSIVMAIVNVFLDYGLIFGHFGLPAWGVKGAAVASVLAELSSLIFYLIYTHGRIDLSHYGIVPRDIFRVDLRLMRVTLNLSVYIMAQALVSTLVWSVFFMMIEKLGERPLAVATIIRSVYILLYIPTISYGTAVSTTVSRLVGAGLGERITEYIRMVGKLSLVTTGGLVLAIGLMPKVVLSIFTDDVELIVSSVPALYVICVALLISSVGNLYFLAVSATGATKKALYIELSTIVGYLLYSAVMVYGVGGPVELCYTVEVLYYIAIAMISYRFISSGKWRDPRWSKPL